MIFNFQFGKTLRASSEAVVAFSRPELPGDLRVSSGYGVQLCRTYGWDLTAGHLFPPGPPASLRSPYGGQSERPFAGGRAAEPLHDALLLNGRLPQQLSGREGGGRDHENVGLEDRVNSQQLYGRVTSTVVAKCTVARPNEARATPRLASYHCRQSSKNDLAACAGKK